MTLSDTSVDQMAFSNRVLPRCAARRPVDVEVERPSGEWYSGRDAQLDTAVDRLLARIDAGGRTRAAPSGGRRDT